MDREFDRGDEVFIRDFPWGRPLNVIGKIVGFLPNDQYNVMLSSGLNEGKIVTFKSWSLVRKKDVRGIEDGTRVRLEE
tara:strand:+ start:28 stop:261 length:234 start_codon:yes stop_codon:yes gene_type:complete